MTRAIGFSIFVVAGLITWISHDVSTMLDRCSARAREVIAAADPLDREPPPSVAKAIGANFPIEELLDSLTTVLLDRYACSRNPSWNIADRSIERPVLASSLPRRLTASELVALFASTAETTKGDIGLAKAAYRFYRKPISALQDADVNCLILRTKGKHITPAPPGMPQWARSNACPEPPDLWLPPVY